MDILHNKVLALLISLAVIAVFSVVGGGATLTEMHATTLNTFHTGGITGDVAEVAAQAHNITVIAGRYLPHDYPGLTDLNAARSAALSALNFGGSPREIYTAYRWMLASSHALRSTLDGMGLSLQDQNLLAGCIAEIHNRVILIENSPYNLAAFRFNNELRRFPASVFVRIFGIAPLELFE